MFSNLKMYLKGFNFFDNKDVICAENCCLEKKVELFLYNESYTLKNFWTKCISVAEEYAKT